jgi:hypothetical protein
MSRSAKPFCHGPTGVGKSWIACALAHTACRNDRSVLYHRVPRLFDALALARGDGRHAQNNNCGTSPFGFFNLDIHRHEKPTYAAVEARNQS